MVDPRLTRPRFVSLPTPTRRHADTPIRLPCGLCQIRTYRTRGSPDLICQRVSFLNWKMLAQFENTDHERHSSLIDVQIPKMSSDFHNIIFRCIMHSSTQVATPIRLQLATTPTRLFPYLPRIGGASSPKSFIAP